MLGMISKMAKIRLILRTRARSTVSNSLEKCKSSSNLLGLEVRLMTATLSKSLKILKTKRLISSIEIIRKSSIRRREGKMVDLKVCLL